MDSWLARLGPSSHRPSAASASGTARTTAGQASSAAIPVSTSTAVSVGVRLTGPSGQPIRYTGPVGWSASAKQAMAAHHHTTAPKASAPAMSSRSGWYQTSRHSHGDRAHARWRATNPAPASARGSAGGSITTPESHLILRRSTRASCTANHRAPARTMVPRPRIQAVANVSSSAKAMA